MAKKKPVKSEDEIGEDLEEDVLEDDELDLPKVKKKAETVEASESDENGDGEEDLDFEPEEEEEPRFTDYVYLDLKLKRGPGDSDFELLMIGQSHGFCNILVKHLLDVPGVEIAAYKITGIVPPQIYIRLDNLSDYDIKKILFQAIENLREKVGEAQKLFQKLL